MIKKYQYSILFSHFKIWLDSYSQEALFYFSETQGEHVDKTELLLLDEDKQGAT